MQNRLTDRKPPITWHEGLLDYFDAEIDMGPNRRNYIGHAVGRQFIGLFVIELVLKYALDGSDSPYDRTHNLHELYLRLPRRSRQAAEDKYAQILADEVPETWDVAHTVESFLKYLGKDPTTDTRYFWERQHSYGRSIVFQLTNVRNVMYALFIALHSYPEGHEYENRYQTKFISLEDSFKERDRRLQEEKQTVSIRRRGMRIRPVVYWLEGLIAYFMVPWFRDPLDIRALGFNIGRRMIGLLLAEMTLKYALDDGGRAFGRNHNLHALFRRLPKPSRQSAELAFAELQNTSDWQMPRNPQAFDELLRELGKDPLEEVRYYWEVGRNGSSLSPGPLVPVVFALLKALHRYPVPKFPMKLSSPA